MGPTCFRRLNSTNIFLIGPLHGLPLFLKPRFHLSLCEEILHPLSLQKKGIGWQSAVGYVSEIGARISYSHKSP